MKILSDLEIAQAAELWPVQEVAAKAGIPELALEYYGRYKAKVDVKALPEGAPTGKVILVTAITPTAAGEGKTTVSVGLASGRWSRCASRRSGLCSGSKAVRQAADTHR